MFEHFVASHNTSRFSAIFHYFQMLSFRLHRKNNLMIITFVSLIFQNGSKTAFMFMPQFNTVKQTFQNCFESIHMSPIPPQRSTLQLLEVPAVCEKLDQLQHRHGSHPHMSDGCSVLQ